MNRLKSMLSIACLATLGGLLTASAATAPTTPDSPPMRHGWHEDHGGPDGGMHQVLDQLDLTAGQKEQMKAIFSQARPQMQAIRESGRANRDQLVTMPPTDPGYAGLIASAKANAAEKIQLMSDLWVQVYEKLTPDQRARIPGIVAAERADRDQHRPRRGQPPASP